jgi:tungstate transport system permease protein
MVAEGLQEGFGLLFGLDPDVWSAVRVSLMVSSISTAVAAALAFPVALGVGLWSFPGRGVVESLLNTMMALPTVVVGLVVYGMISRSGPLGEFGILYTPTAMVVGQAVLAFPLMAALGVASLRQVDRRVRETTLAMGGGEFRAAVEVAWEGRVALLSALVAGFGRVFAEVGVSMMLGGSIRGYTRNLPTGIAFETGRGEFARGVALGVVLLTVALAVNLALQIWRPRRES